MITDKQAMIDAVSGWLTVRKMQDMTQKNIVWAFASGGYTSPEFRSLPYNLALVFAYGVLDDVLRSLKDEGVISPKKSGLKAFMDASRTILPWVDFDLVDKGREERNKLAHELTVVPLNDCLKYTDAVGVELKAWKIIP